MTKPSDPPRRHGRILDSLLLLLFAVGVVPLVATSFRLVSKSREILELDQKSIQLDKARALSQQVSTYLKSLQSQTVAIARTLEVDTPSDQFAARVARIREVAASAGRSLDGFVDAHLAFMTIGDDYDKARATWVRLLSQRYAQDFGPLAGKYGIIGTAAQCAEQLERFGEAGCRYIVVNPICDNEDTERQFEQFAAEVIPRFAADR